MYATLVVAKTYRNWLSARNNFPPGNQDKMYHFHCHSDRSDSVKIAAIISSSVSWPSPMIVHLLSHRVCVVANRVGFCGNHSRTQDSAIHECCFIWLNEISNLTLIYLKYVKISWCSIMCKLKTISISVLGLLQTRILGQGYFFYEILIQNVTCRFCLS